MQPMEPHEDFIKAAPNVEKEQIEKMNTLRIQKIRQIMSEEFKIQGVKLFDLHLLNLKSSKTKYLQHKDIIEIALIFCFFDSKMIFDL